MLDMVDAELLYTHLRVYENPTNDLWSECRVVRLDALCSDLLPEETTILNPFLVDFYFKQEWWRSLVFFSSYPATGFPSVYFARIPPSDCDDLLGNPSFAPSGEFIPGVRIAHTVEVSDVINVIRYRLEASCNDYTDSEPVPQTLRVDPTPEPVPSMPPYIVAVVERDGPRTGFVSQIISFLASLSPALGSIDLALKIATRIFGTSGQQNVG